MNELFDFIKTDDNEFNPRLFDFNREYKNLIVSIIKNCPEFSHIDSRRIAVSYSPAKTNSKYGLQAKIYPLRFEGGASEKIERGYRFKLQPLFHDGEEIFYLIAFCVPRFLNLGKAEKLETIAHELFHISPRFNGDIRRLSGGGKSAHGSSKDIYDKFMEKIVQRYLYSSDRPALPKFLEFDYKKLKQVFLEIKFTKLKVPKILVEKLEH